MKRKHFFIIDKKSGTIKIPAFIARIDSSRRLDLNGLPKPTFLNAVGFQVSPYFSDDYNLLDVSSNECNFEAPSEQKDIPKKQQVEINNRELCKYRDFKHHGPINYSTSTRASSISNLTLIKARQIRNMSTSTEAKLRDQIDRSVLRSTRLATRLACKRYPNLLTDDIFNKYAHIFGLKTR